MRVCRKGRGGEGSAQRGGGRASELTGMGIKGVSACLEGKKGL